tara:strand:+ start:997 stop:3015 length:2019 start_codon:yes stop_codon:yes gene_type:complete
MTKKTDKFLHLALSLSIFITINVNAQTIWTCSEETDQSPTICLDQEGRESIFDINDQDFSLKILGSDFIMNFNFPKGKGNIKGKAGTYISTLIDNEDGTRVIVEMDEKANFIGKEIEYFFTEASEKAFKYYKGEHVLDEDGVAVWEGSGYLEYKNGSTYDGEFKDDNRQGPGIFMDADGEKFVGEFWKDQAIYGTFTYINGDIYTGEFWDGGRHGSGELIYVNGDRYNGNWVENKRHGVGASYFSDEERHLGNYLNGLPHGPGIYYYSPTKPTKMFIGTYKEGKVIDGVYIDQEDRPISSGMRKDAYLHGPGVEYTYKKDGSISSIITGSFKKGVCHGICSEFFYDGSGFKGEYVDGYRNGLGEFTGPLYHTYGLVNSKGIQGKGKQKIREFNAEWEGPFLDDKKNGRGIITFLDNGEKYSATYENDKYVGDLEELSLENFKNKKRIALVIGNDDYFSNPLQYAVADSRGISSALQDAGFDVTHITNTTQEKFLSALYDFERKIKLAGNNTDVLFYYAGHASQVRGVNYLNPVDTVINRESQLEIKSINMNRVFEVLNQSVDGVKIAILDACRNNPFASSLRSAKSGLAQMNAPPGTIIAYSTAPGETALDGSSGGLGIYTGSLIGAIREPGIKIEEVFKETRKNVVTLTGGEQIPWESSSLISDFYFIKKD